MWREQPPGADMFLGKVIGKRLGLKQKWHKGEERAIRRGVLVERCE